MIGLDCRNKQEFVVKVSCFLGMHRIAINYWPDNGLYLVECGECLYPLAWVAHPWHKNMGG